MKDYYGIILIERTELIVRIYEVARKEWRLLQYISKDFPSIKPTTLTASSLITLLAEVFSLPDGQQVSTWKICAREIPQDILSEAGSATGITIENLISLREQELLCKGMFTELW